MPRLKKPQDQGLFEVMQKKGTYGVRTTFEPTTELHHPPVEIDVTDTNQSTAQSLGEMAVTKSPRAELETKKASFKEKFSDNPWIPRTQYELTLALQGLPIAIGHIADKMHRQNQPTARNMYEKAQHYYAQSSRSLIELDDAFVLEGDQDPSVSKIRNDFHIRSMVAEHILAKESFETLKWLPRKAGRANPREKRLMIIMRELELSLSAELLKNWADARESAKNECDFWHQQLETVQDNQRVEEIQRENLQRRL